MGQLKIMELRAEAQKALGKNFDLRAFHDEVLDSGALPLDISATARAGLDQTTAEVRWSGRTARDFQTINGRKLG